SLGYPTPPGAPTWSEELAFNYCAACSLVKTVNPLPPEVLPKENFYSSKVAQVVSDHDREFVEHVAKKASLKNGDVVLEIGSGDGNLLSLFVDKGFKGIGVDPAPHESETPFEQICGFF